MRSTPVILGLFGALAVTAAPAGPILSFRGLGFLPGGSESFAFDVSPDGAAVVGRSRLTDDDREAFLWTPASGMIGLGDLPGGAHDSSGQGVSSGGAAVAGLGTKPSNWFHAFRWTEANGMIDLGDLPGGISHSTALDISADGGVVVGDGLSSSYEAFRWTPEPGMVGLTRIPARLHVEHGVGGVG